MSCMWVGAFVSLLGSLDSAQRDMVEVEKELTLSSAVEVDDEREDDSAGLGAATILKHWSQLLSSLFLWVLINGLAQNTYSSFQTY